MTVSIPLSQGKYALIDDEDYELISRYKWHYSIRRGTSANLPRPKGYTGPTSVCMHRLITDAPEGMVVDHINGNKLDNRRCNLRICTQSQNLMNRRATGGYSKYKGVTWSKDHGKWQANLKYQGKNYYLGMYDDEKRAALAYDAKAREVFREYARLNFPDESYSLSELKKEVVLKSNNTSGYRGVVWIKRKGRNGRWTAFIHVNKKRKYLGAFVDPEDAARAYDKAAKEYHGDQARLNFG